jgi:hypothetical protein
MGAYHTKNLATGGTDHKIVFHAYPVGTIFPSTDTKSITGHVFVEFSSRSRPLAVKGMNRADSWYSLLDWGSVRPENISEVLSIAEFSLEVWVLQNVYDMALDIKRKDWYFLGLNDCVAYAIEVANAIGLSVPLRSEAILPEIFLQKLIQLNP